MEEITIADFECGKEQIYKDMLRMLKQCDTRHQLYANSQKNQFCETTQTL